jgi:C-terminal processing protease CtpA/Prc
MKYYASLTRGRPLFAASFFTFFLFLAIASAQVTAQVSGAERSMAMGMLDITKESIKKNYYDPTYHGVDIEFVFEQAKERMKTAPTRDALMMIIASTVIAFDDSHTNFYPPDRAADVDYGWRVDMIGDESYITGIKPGSDAETKGLKVGDKLISIDGFKPSRKNLWQMYYRYFAIMPSPRVKMIVLRPGEETPRTFDVQTKITKTGGTIGMEALYYKFIRKNWDEGRKDKSYEFGDDLLIWRMSTFSTTDSHVDTMMGKAQKYKSLILDLRDNGGGSVEILKRMIGYFFDREIKIGDEKGRKKTEPLLAKSRGAGVFKGNLIVLVDHNSGSASEIFARIIQMEKRGKIIGDTSAGAVMESRFFEMETGVGNTLWFGASITIADLIMTDGKSLEKVGVTPDETVLPKGADIAASRDPVLSYAAKQFGVDITPEKAGTFFPFEWPK